MPVRAAVANFAGFCQASALKAPDDGGAVSEISSAPRWRLRSSTSDAVISDEFDFIGPLLCRIDAAGSNAR